jgi:hypothetical protein
MRLKIKQKGGQVKKNKFLVGRGKIEWIAYNYQLSNHAEERMLERIKKAKKKTLKERILDSQFAWKTYKGCICIALDLYEYIVVNPSVKNNINGWIPLVVTYVDTKDDGKTVVDKFLEHYYEIVRGDENGEEIITEND